MGLEILLWIWVLTWMTKTAATDVLHAVKGTPNPRYELKRQRAAASGKPAPGRPSYGTREWAADLYSDALAAHTEKRRKAAKAKAQPVDDMIDHVREARPQPQPARVYDPNNSRNCPDCKGEVVVDGHPCPRCLARQQERNAEWEAQGGLARLFGSPAPAPATPPEEPALRPEPSRDWDEAYQRLQVAVQQKQAEWAAAEPSSPDTQPVDPTTNGGRPTLATVIPMFPIMKGSTMPNAEITGLPTAIAFAQGMASAHQAAATAGGEQYVAALRSFEVGDGAISTVATAQELSSQAAAAWSRAADELGKQTTVTEAYQAVPDAGNKRFVTGE